MHSTLRKLLPPDEKLKATQENTDPTRGSCRDTRASPEHFVPTAQEVQEQQMPGTLPWIPVQLGWYCCRPVTALRGKERPRKLRLDSRFSQHNSWNYGTGMES